MRLALDTNILAYAEGVGDRVRYHTSLELLQKLPDNAILIPAQCLGELFRVLTRKAQCPPVRAREAVLGWADSYEIAESTWLAFQAAMDLVTDHKLQIWDGLILSVAAEAHCRLLLSEDMQHGFTWRGVTVVNPYIPDSHPLLASVLGHRTK